jgi:hypothetical protein
MSGLPVIEPFGIPRLGWQFRDRYTLAPRADRLVVGRWMRAASRWIETQNLDPVDLICGMDPGKYGREVVEFERRIETTPDLTWEDFIATGGALENEMQTDQRKPNFFLGIRDENGWIGGLSVANIDIERETDTTVFISAFMFLGVPRAEGLTMPETWQAIYRYLMRNDLDLVDGRKLRIVRYDFLSSDRIRGRHATQPDVEEFVELMRGEYDIEGDSTNRTGPIRFRRRASR